MKIVDKLKSTLRLVKSKFSGKKYIYLQKPVEDMSYEEAWDEFYKKERIIFGQNGKFTGRNRDLVEKIIFGSKDNDYAIDYLVNLLNNPIRSKGVKIDFINEFCNLYDDNELCKIISMPSEKINEQFKVHIARISTERLPENILIQYFDYTNIEKTYVKNLLKNISLDGKITVLNKLTNNELKEALFKEEVGKMDFYEAKKLYEQVDLYDYKEIEKFYIKNIKKLNSDEALNVIKDLNHMTPNLAKELDKKIKLKDVDEVIDFINDNNVKNGGIIYLTRKFSVNNKKKVFYNLNDDNDRKNSMIIFSNDIGKKDFVQMVKDEKNSEVKSELINNMYVLLKESDFNKVNVEDLRNY